MFGFLDIYFSLFLFIHTIHKSRNIFGQNFTIGTFIAFVMGTLAFTGLVLFPSLLHDLRGYPDSAIGILLAARGLGNWLAFFCYYSIDPFDP